MMAMETLCLKFLRMSFLKAIFFIIIVQNVMIRTSRGFIADSRTSNFSSSNSTSLAYNTTKTPCIRLPSGTLSRHHNQRKDATSSENQKSVPLSTDFLNGILRTFQKHACDGEELELNCTGNTIISISLVQYGIPSPSRSQGKQTSSLSSLPSSTFLASAASSQRLGEGHQDEGLYQFVYQQEQNLCYRRSQEKEEINTGHHPSSPPYAYSLSSGQRNQRISLSTNNRDYMISSRDNGGKNCNSTEDLRYALLRSVEETCREKTVCRIMTPLSNFSSIDPCPQVPKLAEVAYKCRPNTFLNKVACEGSTLNLKCREKDEGIAILRAFYGSKGQIVPECRPKSSSSSPAPDVLPTASSLIRVGGGSKQRTNNPRVIPTRSGGKDNEEKCEDDYETRENESETKVSSGSEVVCQASLSTERVTKRCAGQRNCTIPVDSSILGLHHCKPGADLGLHLKVTYACVSRQILKGFVVSGGTSTTTSPLDLLGSSLASPATDDYTGYVEAPRYVPDTESNRRVGGGRILPGFESDPSLLPAIPSRDPRTGMTSSSSSIYELKKLLEKEREQEERESRLVDKHSSHPDQRIDKGISMNGESIDGGSTLDQSSLSHHHLLRRPGSDIQSINPSNEEIGKTRWSTRGIGAYVNSIMVLRAHSRKIMWFMVIFVSVGFLVALLLMSTLMASETYASFLTRRRNDQRRKHKVSKEKMEDGKSSSPPLPSLFHDGHHHHHHHHSSSGGKKSPSPPAFDVSSDEILEDLQAEGLVRSPTLDDYRHEDPYGFLPSHVPLASMIQGINNTSQSHYHQVHHLHPHPHPHHTHHRHDMPLETSLDEVEVNNVVTSTPRVHHIHDMYDHVHYKGNHSSCLGGPKVHFGQTHIIHGEKEGQIQAQTQQQLPPAIPVRESSTVTIHHSSDSQPQLPPILRFNHFYPVLRTSQPNLHQVFPDFSQVAPSDHHLLPPTKDGDTSCSHTTSTMLPSQTVLSSPQRIFYTLGGRGCHGRHHSTTQQEHNNLTDKRLSSTIDRNSFLLKESPSKIPCNESTPPRGLMENENHYY